MRNIWWKKDKKKKMNEFNNYTRVIADFIRVNCIFRDTLEYVMVKPKYDVKMYENRRKALEMAMTSNTPLKVTCDNSQEAGQKLMEKMQELFSLVYGADSSVVRVRGEELTVDTARHLAIFELVIPIHEEIRKIISAHVDAAKKNNKYDMPLIDETIKTDERYYRGFTDLLLFNELEKLFVEYNKARSEAKGAITPQSNFIQNDIAKIVQLINFVRQNGQVTSADYYAYIDPLFALIEMTSGRRDLPTGRTFKDLFPEVRSLITKFVQENEVSYQKCYSQLVQLAVEDGKRLAEEAKKKSDEKVAA